MLFGKSFHYRKVGHIEAIQFFNQMAIQCRRIGIQNTVVHIAGGDPNADALGVPYTTQGIENFEHKARPVFDATTVFILALVGRITQELIGQVTKGGVEFNAIKTRYFSLLSSLTGLLR